MGNVQINIYGKMFLNKMECNIVRYLEKIPFAADCNFLLDELTSQD